VLNLTTGGAPTMTVAERVRPAEVHQPEVASLNMGSMNFGLFGMLSRFKDFKHDWEPAHLGNRDIVFRNSFEDIGFVLETLSGSGTRFEFECYDTAHLYNLKHFLDIGLVKAPLFIQTVFGLGLEDSLWAGPGRMATSNAEQVKLARGIVEGLGLEIATPDEAREILALKGADRGGV